MDPPCRGGERPVLSVLLRVRLGAVDGSMVQITLFSGPERRRRWSDEERLEILNEAFTPGVFEPRRVCRRHWVVSHAAISMLSAAYPFGEARLALLVSDRS